MMIKKLALFVAFSSFIFNTTRIVAQENLLFNGKQHKVGFVFSIGGQKLDQFVYKLEATEKERFNFLTEVNPGLNVTYTYDVRAFQLQYYHSILRKKSWGIDLLGQPQYNTVMFKLKDCDINEMKSFEIGLNIGVLFRKNFLSDKLSLYTCLSSGPHYISKAPDRQTSGFIFSDNLFGGLNYEIMKDFYLDVRAGFRHLSNAGIRHPNRGINAIILGCGFFFIL